MNQGEKRGGSSPPAVSRERIRLTAYGLLLTTCLLIITGCSPEWRRKFVRKKKNVSPPQPVLVLQADMQAIHPPAVRYREHFAYWKSWHSELMASLGQIRKRDLRYLNGAAGELRSLAELLSGSSADRMREISNELSEMEVRWSSKPASWRVSVRDRLRLEQIEREINRDFHYSNIQSSIPGGTEASAEKKD